MIASLLSGLHTALQQTAEGGWTSEPTGLEWMTVGSFVVPAILLAVIIYLGSKSTVRRP